MIRRPAVLGAAVLATVAVSCDGCPPGTVQIDNHPAFQLTYIDRNDRVRVRYSDNAETWSDGNLNALADAGVGASSSPDIIGVTRVVADGSNIGRLELWFGVGPATWDASSVPLSTLRPGRRPTIVDMGDDRYLIAFIPINSNSFELWLYDHDVGQTTQIPIPAGYGNDSLHLSPAMAFLPADANAGRLADRAALAWGRYELPQSTRPYEIRTMWVEHSQGNVVVGSGHYVIKSDSMPPNYFGSIPHLLSEPAMTHDHTKFILASHQRFYGVQPVTRSSYYVQMHTSPNGRDWEEGVWVDFTDGIYDEVGFLEFAIQPSCLGILVFIPVGSAAVHAQIHRPNGSEQTLNLNDVFGSNLPAQRQFALITTGRPASVPAEGCSRLNFAN